MNYYPFHIGDYLTATRHLSWDEDLAYRRLIEFYYISEKPLPLDKPRIYATIGTTTPAHREAVDKVLAEFFTETTSGYWHERCEEEIAKAADKREKASFKAHKRWHSSATAMPGQSKGNAPNPNPNPKLKGARAKEGEASTVPVFENTAAWAAWKATGKRFSAMDIRTDAGIKREIAAGGQGNHMRGQVRRSPVQTIVSRHTAALLQAEAELCGLTTPGYVHKVLTAHCEALEMFANGIPADDIATLQKKPVKQVLADIGRAVDREAQWE